MKRGIVFIIVLLLLGGVIGGFSYFQFVMKPEMIKQAMSSNRAPPVTVTAEAAKSATWKPLLPAVGTFRAVHGVEIAPQVDGIVEAIHFQSGQQVGSGTLIVELDTEVEEADLKSGQAQLKETEVELKRQQELLSRGNTSQRAYDQALAQRDTAAASVERSRALIDQKEILAPFDGRLGLRQVDLGEYVSAGTPLVSLQSLDPIYVDFPIPEQSFERLQVGQETQVRVDAYPGTVFGGKIHSIDARVSPETRAVLVRAEIDNPDMRLLPGMFANVNVVAGDPLDVVAVPRTAIDFSLYGDSVYVVQKAGTDGQDTPATADDLSGTDSLVVERRFVQVGETRESLVAIAKGVKPGEVVVTSGQIKLQPKAHVTIDNSNALQPPAQLPKQ